MNGGTNEIRDEAARRQAGMRLLSSTMREFAEKTSDYHRLLEIVAKRIAELIGDVCVVFLLSSDKQTLEAAAFYDHDPDIVRQYRDLFARPLSMADASVARQVTLSGNAVCVPVLDVEQFRSRTTPESFELHRRIGAHGFLVVPLRVQSEPIGAITIVRYRPQGQRLDALDVEIAGDLASHAALAIANSRLMRRAEGELAKREAIEAALGESERLRSAEQDAIRARRFLEAIIENIPDMVFVKDAATLAFTRFNRAGVELLGVPEEALLGKSDYDFFPADEADFFVKKDRETLADKTMIDIPEESIQTKNGVRWLHTKKVPIVDSNGEPLYLLGISQDITEQRQARAALLHAKEAAEAANRELEAFSYSVAHDLRAPLRSIDGFSQALLEDYADKFDDTALDYLHRVRSSAQHMAELIDGLLSLSRVTRADMQRDDVDLGKLAHAALQWLRVGSEDRRVETIISGALGTKGDPRLLAVVVENLVGNAWKFTSGKEGARVEVGSVSREGETVFFVKDNGAGFDMAYSERLFGVFERLHRAADFAGTGIGLATVKRIILRHGGRIWAEGMVGQGATFYFTVGDRQKE